MFPLLLCYRYPSDNCFRKNISNFQQLENLFSIYLTDSNQIKILSEFLISHFNLSDSGTNTFTKTMIQQIITYNFHPIYTGVEASPLIFLNEKCCSLLITANMYGFFSYVREMSDKSSVNEILNKAMSVQLSYSFSLNTS